MIRAIHLDVSVYRLAGIRDRQEYPQHPRKGPSPFFPGDGRIHASRYILGHNVALEPGGLILLILVSIYLFDCNIANLYGSIQKCLFFISKTKHTDCSFPWTLPTLFGTLRFVKESIFSSELSLENTLFVTFGHSRINPSVKFIMLFNFVTARPIKNAFVLSLLNKATRLFLTYQYA